MKCNDAEKLILLEDSGELGARQAETLNSHLRRCDVCREFRQSITESKPAFNPVHEPGVKAVQEVLREARRNVPQRKTIPLFGLKPALAMAASVLIVLGFFLSAFHPGKVGLELEVTEVQLMETEDQLVDVMYSGLSDDDLAFNFLMTYEEG